VRNLIVFCLSGGALIVGLGCIVADFGVTTVSGDEFSNIGGSDMYSAGGSFAVVTP